MHVKRGAATTAPIFSGRKEMEMWQKALLPVLPLPLLLLFLAYKEWDKRREIHNLVSRLRSSGVL